LLPFLDRLELFLNGCPCDSDLHWEQTEWEYRKIRSLDLSDLKQKLNVEKLDWYLNGQLLFTT
jgi:hypothetical protein